MVRSEPAEIDRRREAKTLMEAARAKLKAPTDQLVIDYLDHALFELNEIERRSLPAASAGS